MRKLLSPLMAPLVAIALSAGLASAAIASDRKGDTPRYRGFDGQVAQLSGPIALDIQLGEQLAYLADHQGDRIGVRSFRKGFATGGFLGADALDYLVEETGEELVERLTKKGITIDPDASTVLRITLVDARPNRPTFAQLSAEPSLSQRSFGTGGASMEGELISAGGQSLGSFTYGWYDNQLDQFDRTGTWRDANRAIDFFARKLSKKLA